MSLHPQPTTEFKKRSSQLELIHTSSLIHSYLHTYWSEQLVTCSSWPAAYAQTHSYDFWEETGDKGRTQCRNDTLTNHCWLSNAEYCTCWPWGHMSHACKHAHMYKNGGTLIVQRVYWMERSVCLAALSPSAGGQSLWVGLGPPPPSHSGAFLW